MNGDAQELWDWILQLRPDAVQRVSVLTFDPVPLWVAIIPHLPSESKMEVLEMAGVTDVETLVEGFRSDVFEVEGAELFTLNRAEGFLQVRELISISWWCATSGTRDVSIAIARTQSQGLVMLYELDAAHSFNVFGLGPDVDLQSLVAAMPDSVLPRLGFGRVIAREIRIHAPVCWTQNDVEAIARELTGIADSTSFELLGSGKLAR